MAPAWGAARLARLLRSRAPRAGARRFASAAPAAPDGAVVGTYSRQADLAKSYLKEYEAARISGNAHEALRMLKKASAAAQGVHVRLPLGHGQKDSVVPLCALIPDFHCAGGAPRFELPVTVRVPLWPERVGPARVLAEGVP